MSARLRARTLGAIVACAAAGCDPLLSVSASVRSAPPTCGTRAEVYAGGEPVRGATVSLQCPDRPGRDLGTTGASGRVEYESVGLLSTDCKVTVVAPGYLSQEFRVADLCVANEGRTLCHFMNVHAELVRQ